MNLLAVIPALTGQNTKICLESILAEDSSAGLSRDEILVVDNSKAGLHTHGLETYRDVNGHNIGVAGAWNVGAREVLTKGLDYLVIISTSIQFGPILHCTWKWQMEQFWGENVIEADGHSWHLIAFHRRVFEAVGLFDENFYPAYEEAIDFGYRMRQVDMEGNWRRVWVNALSRGSAMHVDTVHCPNPPLVEYYISKWGGKKGEEKWTLPFGDKPLDYWESIPIPELARRYNLEKWW